MLLKSDRFCSVAFCPGKSMDFVKECQKDKHVVFTKVAVAYTEIYRVYLVYAYGAWSVIPYRQGNSGYETLPRRDCVAVPVQPDDLESEESIFMLLRRALSIQFPKAEEGYREEPLKMAEVLSLLESDARITTLCLNHVTYSLTGDAVLIYCLDGTLTLPFDGDNVKTSGSKKSQIDFGSVIGDMIIVFVTKFFSLPGAVLKSLRERFNG